MSTLLTRLAAWLTRPRHVSRFVVRHGEVIRQFGVYCDRDISDWHPIPHTVIRTHA